MPVTIAAFRRMALGFPGASEGAHMGHPDFRVRNKIFASLGEPNASWGMVKLTRAQHDLVLAVEPGAFTPAPGAWGQRGYTRVRLAAAERGTLHSALAMAWLNLAPRPSAPGQRR